MTKKAANEDKLGQLHELLSEVFLQELQCAKDSGEATSPALLSAVSKFLKDNEIMHDTDALDELTAFDMRIQDKKKNRAGLKLEEISLTEDLQ